MLTIHDAGVIDDLYAYGANANVTSITDNLSGTFTRTMAYDERGRLTDATNAPLWGGTHTFVYDPLDNIRHTINPAFGDWTYIYNATTQRLDRIDPSGSRAIISYGYDTRGRATARTTSGAAQTFTIDLADRVKAVNPAFATYRYDGFGRRTSVTKGSTTTVQVYSPAGQLMYQSSPSASDGIFRSGFQSGDTPYPPAGGGNKRYIYLGPHLVAEDGTAGRSYIHTDGLGSPARTTNSAGTPSGREDYKPYGWGPLPQSTPSFTGHVADAETGLLYMQARYYDPFAGRFLATDPVEASAFAFNRYWYANNNPYRYIDPDGRAACPKRLGNQICYDSPKTETGTAVQPGPSERALAKDRQVQKAVSSGMLSDGTRLNTRDQTTNEQGIRITTEGTYSNPFEKICWSCSNGDSGTGGEYNISALQGDDSPGHTHAGLTNPLPGRGDAGLTGVTGQGAYIISGKGAFVIEKTEVGYRVRQISGKGLRGPEKSHLIKQIDGWNTTGGASNSGSMSCSSHGC